MTRFKILAIVMLLNTFVSCNKSLPDFAVLETEKEFNFGTVTLNDTIKHVFKIRNSSDVPLKISEIGTSCGCTGAIISDSIINKNEFTEVEVIFIPQKQQIGEINNSIVVVANTNPPFTVIYLNGIVVDKL